MTHQEWLWGVFSVLPTVNHPQVATELRQVDHCSSFAPTEAHPTRAFCASLVYEVGFFF